MIPRTQYMTDMKTWIGVFGVVGMVTAGCLGPQARTAAAADLERLLEDHWELRLREHPQFATYVGDRRYDDRLADAGEAAEARRAAADRVMLRRAAAIDRDGLDPQERISLAIFERQRRESLAAHAFGAWMMPVSPRWGFHVAFATLPDKQPLDSVADYEAYLKRLAAFGDHADQHIQVMRRGIARGLVLPAVIMRGMTATAEAGGRETDERVERLSAPFERFPKSISAADQKRLRRAGRSVIEAGVAPAYRRFDRFLVETYVPAGRASVGVSELPGGKAWYRECVKRFTTLSLTPEEIHATGLAEVARIRHEMEAIIASVNFAGDFGEFVAFLRRDPRFYATTPQQLMSAVALVLKRMDGALPKLFLRLPRAPYGLKKVPDYIAPRTHTAYYQPPTGGGRTAGFYFVNTYDLKQRPLYEIEALSLHEAVPGHHLQIALAQELEELPRFRRFVMFGAYVEGWALYAERLGLEVGFYTDPYRDFGRLTYEMWRACRLVVDTGLHAFGWSRQRAIDFMTAHTALSTHNIATEVDRYIGWPGQALGYKIGELKIRALRADAERQLGAAFDVRMFHDVVLRNGAIPLDILVQQVRQWVAQTMAARRSKTQKAATLPTP